MNTAISATTPSATPKLDSKGRAYGTGRRKSSIARVWVKPGSGKFVVNGKEFADYFARSVLQMVIMQPMEVIEAIGKYDIICTVKGGGLTGQAGAVRLGMSRALVELNQEIRPKLRHNSFLTRDSRVVERKKYGLKKARKRPQFSKR